MHFSVIFAGRQAGKASAQKAELKKFVDNGQHTHAVMNDETICYNGTCAPLRRATNKDKESLIK